ncbi:PREDICTED: clumping factor A-like isoform X2 [Priapulus caudatus]|uniref:Clumping factor A-like isoform X2 n=1 Tax=Priapulus caudatus TaxID=37621 RepID=A0ABM1EX28_PRICU|nr:PREDICTED: clumping factor A-like isoform X2 [Priapulus caudatus]
MKSRKRSEVFIIMAIIVHLMGLANALSVSETIATKIASKYSSVSGVEHSVNTEAVISDVSTDEKTITKDNDDLILGTSDGDHDSNANAENTANEKDLKEFNIDNNGDIDDDTTTAQDTILFNIDNDGNNDDDTTTAQDTILFNIDNDGNNDDDTTTTQDTILFNIDNDGNNDDDTTTAQDTIEFNIDNDGNSDDDTTTAQDVIEFNIDNDGNSDDDTTVTQELNTDSDSDSDDDSDTESDGDNDDDDDINQDVIELNIDSNGDNDDDNDINQGVIELHTESDGDNDDDDDINQDVIELNIDDDGDNDDDYGANDIDEDVINWDIDDDDYTDIISQYPDDHSFDIIQDTGLHIEENGENSVIEEMSDMEADRQRTVAYITSLEYEEMKQACCEFGKVAGDALVGSPIITCWQYGNHFYYNVVGKVVSISCRRRYRRCCIRAYMRQIPAVQSPGIGYADQ